MVIMKLRLHIIERELSLMETRLRRKDGFCQKGRTGKMTAGEENGDLVYGRRTDRCKNRGERKTYPAGVSFLSIAQEYQEQYEDDIVLALYNNRLRELKKTIKKDGELSFLTTSDKTGKRAYRRSVTLLMQKAVYNLWGREHIGVYVRYAIGQGYYCELMKDGESCKITETMIGALKKEMYRLVMADLPIENTV